MAETIPLQHRLREALQLRNMKAVDLARKTGVPKPAISVYLAGTSKPKANRLYVIAKALDVSEAWLLGYDVPMNKTEDQKKNDQLAELIVKMRKSQKYFDVVAKLSKVDEDRLDLIDKLIDSITNK